MELECLLTAKEETLHTGRHLRTSEEGLHGAGTQILKDSCQQDGSGISKPSQ